MKISHSNRQNYPNNPYFQKGGFSLIELVFAVLLLTIVILGVVGLQTSNLAMMNSEKNQIQAYFLADQGIQIVRAIGFGAVDNAYTLAPPDNCNATPPCYRKLSRAGSDYTMLKYEAQKESITYGNQTFERLIKIEADTMNLPSAYKIRSIVGWEDSTGSHQYDPDPSKASHVESSLIIYGP